MTAPTSDALVTKLREVEQFLEGEVRDRERALGVNTRVGTQLLKADALLKTVRQAAEALAASPRSIDVEAMRANLHATFNGGHRSEATIDAFHHGMDTVCNVLAAHQKGDGTNGILPRPDGGTT